MIIQSNTPQLPRGSIGFGLGIAGMLVSLYYSIMFISGNATETVKVFKTSGILEKKNTGKLEKC